MKGASSESKLENFHLSKAEKEIKKVLNKTKLDLPEGFDQEHIKLELKTSGNALSLSDALKIAIVNNPSIQSRREELNERILAFHQNIDSYSPQLQSTLSYIIAGSKTAVKSEEQQHNLDLSQKTGFGGLLNFNVSNSIQKDSSSSYQSRMQLDLSQPLLRKAGKKVSDEEYVQGKRSLLYEFRSFKDYIDRFSVSIIREYTNIINRKIKNNNLKRQYLKDAWLYRRTLAYFNRGRISKLELLRVTQRMHSTENQWKNQIQILQNSIENFKLTLNYNSEKVLILKPFRVKYAPLDAKGIEDISIAFEHRLDYKTAINNVEDAQRRYKLAKNDLLPNLSLNAGAGIENANTSNHWKNQNLNQHDYHASIQLQLPLNKQADRLNLYSTRNTINRRERDLKLLRSSISIDVRNRTRRIKQLEKSIEIQDLILASEEKRYGVAQFRFQNGDVSNREVIEASESLTAAQNIKLDLHLEHYIERLELKIDLGTLNLKTLFDILENNK